MRIALAVASLLLVAGGAAACGGDDDDSGAKGGANGDGGGAADKGVSTEDFCGAFQDFSEDLEGVTGTEGNLGEILKKAVKRIEDVGTPDDITDDAKEGLQITIDAINSLPDDASAEDMAGLTSGISEEEQKKVDAFSDYLEKTCPDLSDGGASEDPSEGASEDASDGSDGGS